LLLEFHVFENRLDLQIDIGQVLVDKDPFQQGHLVFNLVRGDATALDTVLIILPDGIKQPSNASCLTSSVKNYQMPEAIKGVFTSFNLRE
jgi:hypothetical protein